MTTLTRHVGRIANTGTRIIVVFREIPDDPTHCLVVESDRLPDMYHDNIMKILNGKEGQNTTNFFEVLARTSFGDGRPCLQTLHSGGYLRKQLVSNVEMMPFPNQPVPLQIINAEISSSSASKNADEKEMTAEEAIHVTHARKDLDTDDAKARAMIDQAKKLEEQASRIREEAYMLSPELRPARGRPLSTDAKKESARRKRNQLRREKYQQEQKMKKKLKSAETA